LLVHHSEYAFAAGLIDLKEKAQMEEMESEMIQKLQNG